MGAKTWIGLLLLGGAAGAVAVATSKKPIATSPSAGVVLGYPGVPLPPSSVAPGYPGVPLPPSSAAPGYPGVVPGYPGGVAPGSPGTLQEPPEARLVRVLRQAESSSRWPVGVRVSSLTSPADGPPPIAGVWRYVVLAGGSPADRTKAAQWLSGGLASEGFQAPGSSTSPSPITLAWLGGGGDFLQGRAQAHPALLTLYVAPFDAKRAAEIQQQRQQLQRMLGAMTE